MEIRHFSGCQRQAVSISAEKLDRMESSMMTSNFCQAREEEWLDAIHCLPVFACLDSHLQVFGRALHVIVDRLDPCRGGEREHVYQTWS